MTIQPAHPRHFRAAPTLPKLPAGNLSRAGTVEWPTYRDCHYILNDGPWTARNPPRWCGKPAKTGSSYCAGHHRDCYVSAKGIPKEPRF